LIGAWIGGIISKRASMEAVKSSNQNAVILIQQQEFNKAATVVRSAFVDVLLFLEFGVTSELDPVRDDIKICDFLRSFAAGQLKAIIEFKPFLSECERIGIERAWDEYCHPEGIPEDKSEKRNFILDGYFHIEESSSGEKAKKIALEKINNILKFASFK